jgi:hypothetical protein
MFGYVTASQEELSEEQKRRYGAVYCGICRAIKDRSDNFSRLCLRYDMAFLAKLLMSLYEPEEESGGNACCLHPIKKRPWVNNEYIGYAADMNVALAYYKELDDWNDDRSLRGKALSGVFGKHLPGIMERYPRQCAAIQNCIRELSRLEKENCSNPDETANCFGALMAELTVYREDFWADTLRSLGFSLGRFIYLLDCAIDYAKDEKRGNYNPFLAMGTGCDWLRWENYLVMDMACCTEQFEKLPLVQDKLLLDNILYSGVWAGFREAQQRREEKK